MAFACVCFEVKTWGDSCKSIRRPPRTLIFDTLRGQQHLIFGSNFACVGNSYLNWRRLQRQNGFMMISKWERGTVYIAYTIYIVIVRTGICRNFETVHELVRRLVKNRKKWEMERKKREEKKHSNKPSTYYWIIFYFRLFRRATGGWRAVKKPDKKVIFHRTTLQNWNRLKPNRKLNLIFFFISVDVRRLLPGDDDHVAHRQIGERKHFFLFEVNIDEFFLLLLNWLVLIGIHFDGAGDATGSTQLQACSKRWKCNYHDESTK